VLPGSYATGTAGYFLGHQLGGTFTTATSSIFNAAALANAPTGGGGGGVVTGYAIGQDPASYVLSTPANKLATDASGRIDVGKILGGASLGIAGTVAIDWSEIVNKTASVDLPNTTISPTQTTAVDFSHPLGAPRDLTSIPDNQLTATDALHCAISKAAGKETVVDTTYTVMTPAGTTVRIFTLDQNPNPGSRT
jgi:hypothetical protein